MRTSILSALLLFGCQRGDQEGSGLPTEAELAVLVQPSMDVASPSRVVFAPGGAVTVSGSVTSGSAPVRSLALNGESIPLDETGQFSSSIQLEPGINVLGLRAEDDEGGRAVDGRAVYGGPLHEPDTTLVDAVRIQIGPDLLDDNNSDIDDVASIAESLLSDGSLSSAFIGVPIDTDFAEITPTSLDYGDVEIDIVPRDGSISASVVLYDVWMDFDVDGGFFYTDGSAWLDAMTLSLVFDVDRGGVTASESVATLDGYGLTVDWFPDWLEDDLADWTVETLEEEIAGTASSTVSGLIDEYLDAFAVDAELVDGVDLSVSLRSVQSSRAGLQLEMSAAVSADSSGLTSNAGSALTRGGPPAWPTGDVSFWASVDDDVVNQLLFAIWSVGMLDGFTYSGAELALLTGAELAPPLGPVSTVDLGVKMPPSLLTPTMSDMTADLGLGEWTMVFHREDGEVLSFSVNARTGTQVLFSESDELMFALDNRPANMTLAIGVKESPEYLDPGDLAALVKLMVPPLFGNASSFLPGVALPPLDLGLVSESMDGILLIPSNLDLSLSSNNWLIIDGGLAPQ